MGAKQGVYREGGHHLIPQLLGPLQLPLHIVQLLAQLLPAVLRLTPVMFQDVQEDALGAGGPWPACLLGGRVSEFSAASAPDSGPLLSVG